MQRFPSENSPNRIPLHSIIISVLKKSCTNTNYIQYNRTTKRSNCELILACIPNMVVTAFGILEILDLIPSRVWELTYPNNNVVINCNYVAGSAKKNQLKVNEYKINKKKQVIKSSTQQNSNERWVVLLLMTFPAQPRLGSRSCASRSTLR